MSQNIDSLFVPNYNFNNSNNSNNSNYLNKKYNNLYYDIFNKKMYKNKLSNSDSCPKFIKKKSKINNNILQNFKCIKKRNPKIYSESNSYSNNILPNIELFYNNNIENNIIEKNNKKFKCIEININNKSDELDYENEKKLKTEYYEYLKHYYNNALVFYYDYYNENINTNYYEKTSDQYDLTSYYKELRLFFSYYENYFNKINKCENNFNEINKHEYNIISDLNIFNDIRHIDNDSDSSIFLYIKQQKKYYEYENNNGSCSFDTENSDILEYEKNKIQNIKNNLR